VVVVVAEEMWHCKVGGSTGVVHHFGVNPSQIRPPHPMLCAVMAHRQQDKEERAQDEVAFKLRGDLFLQTFLAT
jgi:hypothetical protein